MLGKTRWYKDRKRLVENPFQEGWKLGRADVRTEKPSGRVTKPGKEGIKKQVRTASVLFVPRTENGELKRRLQIAEEEISAITGDRIKMVERAGRKLKSILHTPNPWSGVPVAEKLVLCVNMVVILSVNASKEI